MDPKVTMVEVVGDMVLDLVDTVLDLVDTIPVQMVAVVDMALEQEISSEGMERKVKQHLEQEAIK